MLAEKIAQAQVENEQSMLDVIDQFKRLLGRYARLLQYEDAQSDLTVEFIALIKQIDTSIFKGKGDGAVVNYIVQAVNHIYIKLSKHYGKYHSGEILMCDLGDEELYCLEAHAATPTDELRDLMQLLSCDALTPLERNTLILAFYWGLSSAEIAQK